MAYLLCPECRRGSVLAGADSFHCDACGARFPLRNGIPVLLRKDNELMWAQIDARQPRAPRGKLRISAAIPSPSVNLARKHALASIRDHLWGLSGAKILVVGSGEQREELMRALPSHGHVRVLCTDISPNADVDIVCDVHDLPFAAEAFEVVIATAVLEHVLYPERAAEELSRVTKMGGLVYSETPFMQQVHEGAFDFSRFTLLGHRRLLNNFQEIRAGMVAGPGTTLVWAIEHFVAAFAPGDGARKVVRALVRILLGWLKYSDYLLRNSPAALDGASCTYFLGKRIGGKVSDAEVVRSYYR